ncbi:hypothetical protein CIY_27000 [Butyrivibrio fibrisolvens 16/4]|nr:hypothetical protein CIY_27000 [Butyrivibrio fibrisolvens 16/4]
MAQKIMLWKLDVWGYRIYETVVLDHEQEVEVKVISKSNLKIMKAKL